MTLELIKGDREIRALKPGAKRLNDGGGLHLLPFAKGLTHYWRLDYTFDGKRKTLSVGMYPKTGLAEAREKAIKALTTLAAGVDPSDERRAQRSAIREQMEAQQRQADGLPPVGSFEAVARRWFAVKQSLAGSRPRAAAPDTGTSSSGWRMLRPQCAAVWCGAVRCGTDEAAQVAEQGRFIVGGKVCCGHGRRCRRYCRRYCRRHHRYHR